MHNSTFQIKVIDDPNDDEVCFIVGEHSKIMLWVDVDNKIVGSAYALDGGYLSWFKAEKPLNDLFNAIDSLWDCGYAGMTIKEFVKRILA